MSSTGRGKDDIWFSELTIPSFTVLPLVKEVPMASYNGTTGGLVRSMMTRKCFIGSPKRFFCGSPKLRVW